jgi:hypothetical protein
MGQIAGPEENGGVRALNVKLRSRFALEELTPRRIYQGVARRLTDIPHGLAWSMPSEQAHRNRERLEAVRDRHAGQRCFILGNGPSLARMNLAPLQKEITFGLNRIYLLFDELRFVTSYHICVNELVLEQFAHEIGRLRMPRFLNWNGRGLFDAAEQGISFLRISPSLGDRFAGDLRGPISSGGTVTYVAMQVAFAMGFSEVILIGVDHSFADRGTPNEVQVRRAAKDLNHFHPDYFPQGFKWQLPDLRRSEIAYELARQAYEEAGRRLVDATLDGKCPVFERVEYASLF